MKPAMQTRAQKRAAVVSVSTSATHTFSKSVSMGGMQVLQWGVSHPEMMDGLVGMVPLAKTPAWTVVVLETTRRAIMLDPAWNGGNYTAMPEKGVRLWRYILNFLAARTPDMYRGAIQYRHGRAAVDDAAGRCCAEGFRCQ